MTERKCYYTHTDVHTYVKKDGSVSTYHYNSAVERKRKIASTEEDFKAFMLEFDRIKNSKQAAKNVKIAYSAVVKMAFEKCLPMYISSSSESSSTQQDDSASQSYLSSPTV
jgi:hypothetical protein